MQIKNYSQIATLIEAEFPKFRKTIQKNFSLITLALLQGYSCSLPEIALNMTKMNNASHHTNLVRLERFLQSKEFKTEDQEWRMFILFMFNALEERNLIQKGDHIPINIDYTSKENDFLILSASIPFHNRGIPIYFSMRIYPSKKYELSLVKMEKAFIKELKHLLPKTYRYTIVADRGFGNKRFANLCLENNFNYIVRIKSNLTANTNNQKTKVKNLGTNKDFQKVSITLDNWETRLVSKELNDNEWYIVTSLVKNEYKQIIHWYEKRFNIEKMFQDEKSSGFDFENSKIKKYSRFKRLLFCIFFSQALLMFIGNFIEENDDELKKKFRIHINIISAFFN